MTNHRVRRLLAAAILPLAAGACAPRVGPARYAPRVRDITVTTVPLLVKEDAPLFPFLKEDFARGGVLENREVYAFSPSTITVVEGDTIRFTFINPEDDVHSFVLPDFSVALPGQRVTHATYAARRAGIFAFRCSIPTHLPMMWGQLVVLPASAMAGAESAASPGAPGHGDDTAGR